MKTITICGKEFPIECNAFTRFQYKSIFGKGIFEDISVLNDFSTKQEELRKELKKKKLSDEEIDNEINKMMLQHVDDFLDVIEKMAYILIYTANSNIGSFEDWLKGITKIELSENWTSEVAELAVNSFC